MMVAVKDMKMPERCWECNCYDDNGDYPICILTGYAKGYKFNGREKRMDDCPLVEIEDR